MMQTLYLLDGMALVYRAHFALARSPIVTSTGVNTSAIYGFANTLIELLTKKQPTHLAVVFDTQAPTERHVLFPAYKAQRDEMPEDIGMALPYIRRLCAAMNVPLITLDGYEADDIIGTLARQAEATGDFTTYMVTPDKDFGQLVTERTFIYKPPYAGGEAEILGVAEVCARWQIDRPAQVVDILGLWGDASDNIPGIAGIGEKTASTLIKTYGSIENLLAHTAELKGKQKEKIEAGAEMARLSKKLATIITDAPVTETLDSLAIRPRDDESLQQLLAELEFNSLGRRLFGADFKAGQVELKPSAAAAGVKTPAPVREVLKTIHDVPHDYRAVETAEARAALIRDLLAQPSFCFDTETTSVDEKTAVLIGLAFSWQKGTGYFVPTRNEAERASVLAEFAPVFTHPQIEKIGHNLKYDLNVLGWHGLDVVGPFFDTMLAHALIDPDRRHGLDHLAEEYLRYTPIAYSSLFTTQKDGTVAVTDDLFAAAEARAEKKELTMADLAQSDLQRLTDYAAEDADVTWQLAAVLRPLITSLALDRICYEVEMPLIPVLGAMERRGITVDPTVLARQSQELQQITRALESEITALAGGSFNLNSPRQLGEVLFGRLRLSDKPKKTKTGQYQTNEEVLQELLGKHPIIEKILEFRETSKLLSTYVDALPSEIFTRTGRVHTVYLQLIVATGRLSSNQPNLQNIPIRTPQGREVRRAFVPARGWKLICADYSQIELRVMAALSGDAGMKQAFAEGLDIHSATASRVYGTPVAELLPEMRRAAKMVNFGIIYGISAFGLAQRLGIPREEARRIIDEYFVQYPGVKQFMDRVVATAREKGYVETMWGRRRPLRDITSANATLRSAAERVAINTPIQGTAADMIKLAMIRVSEKLRTEGHQARLLLQVHDELVLEAPPEEVEAVKALVINEMTHALPLPGVPIVVECGVGDHWLEAH